MTVLDLADTVIVSNMKVKREEYTSKEREITSPKKPFDCYVPAQSAPLNLAGVFF